MPNHTDGPTNSPFDITLIRNLVRLMRDNELSEISLQWESAKVRLRRGGIPMSGPMPAVMPTAMPAVMPTAMPAMMGSSPTGATGTSPTGLDASQNKPAPALYIKSPTVGTFFTAPEPNAEPFVKVGSKVREDSIVCIIEAMKCFNEIPSGVVGTIVEVLVDNGAPVEFGQNLFRYEP